MPPKSTRSASSEEKRETRQQGSKKREKKPFYRSRKKKEREETASGGYGQECLLRSKNGGTRRTRPEIDQRTKSSVQTKRAQAAITGEEVEAGGGPVFFRNSARPWDKHFQERRNRDVLLFKEKRKKAKTQGSRAHTRHHRSVNTR